MPDVASAAVKAGKLTEEEARARWAAIKKGADAKKKTVPYYCNKRLGGNPGDITKVFRMMRKELANHQGELRNSWLHVILIDNIAFAGVPGECFGQLGIKIKRRSPFRCTYVIGLANDYIGYIPEYKAYDLGGYQL